MAGGNKRCTLIPMSGAEAPVPAEIPAGAREDEDRERFLAAIAEGLADADAGRVHSHTEVVARMRARFAARSK